MNSTPVATYSVSELNFHIKDILENAPFFRDIWIEGELSNVKLYERGNQLYFNLIDGDSQLNCVVYSSFLPLIKFEPKSGMKVRIRGRLTVFHKRGTYSFQVAFMSQQGLGQQNLALEKLKKQLKKEGLFDEERKKQLPLFPDNVALITAPNSAALADFLKIASAMPFMSIDIIPAVMQGQSSALSVIQALGIAHSHKTYDAVVILRGGGSSEDLSSFNDETLVRIVSEYEVPIVSAIGHDIDYTLLDFVSDKRSATPTQAAQFLIEPFLEKRSELLTRLTYTEKHLMNKVMDQVIHIQDTLAIGIDHLNLKYEALANHLNQTISKLDLVNPLKKFRQGFSISKVEGQEQAVRSISEISVNDKLITRLEDGLIFSTVETLEKTKVPKDPK
jgi:exodeoxyribonuclease VII large subunit